MVILALWGVLSFEYKKEPNVMTCQFGFDIISAIFLYHIFDVLKLVPEQSNINSVSFNETYTR